MYSYRMIYLIMSQKLNNSLRDFIIFSSERERVIYSTCCTCIVVKYMYIVNIFVVLWYNLFCRMFFSVRSVFLSIVILMVLTRMVQLEEGTIVLSQWMSGSLSRELIGRGSVGQPLKYSILMPLGFQSYLVT